MTLSLDMANVFGERRGSYQYVPGRTQQVFMPNQTISLGLRGQF
jgi:hypothetical protein